jgi:hypothetical protein
MLVGPGMATDQSANEWAPKEGAPEKGIEMRTTLPLTEIPLCKFEIGLAARLRHFLHRSKTPLRILPCRQTNSSRSHTDSPFDKFRPRYQTTVQFKIFRHHANTAASAMQLLAYQSSSAQPR